jgi:hypothetical protein
MKGGTTKRKMDASLVKVPDVAELVAERLK